jgi:hypothetical protein
MFWERSWGVLGDEAWCLVVLDGWEIFGESNECGVVLELLDLSGFGGE